MKLLLATPYFYPKIGGLENYAFNIAKGLHEKYKWEIVVVTSNHKEKKYIVEKMEGLKIYRLPILFKVSNTPINPLWVKHLKKIINSEKPDVINAHTPVPGLADISALLSGKIPFFVTYHAVSLYKENNLVFDLFISLYRVFEKTMFNKAKGIIVVSPYIKANFPKKMQNKITIIPNFINIKNISPKSVSQFSSMLLFISNLNKAQNWKGLNLILESIKIYIETYDKNITLIVVGDGNYKYFYESLAKKLDVSKYVNFVGEKTQKDKEKVLKKSDLLISYPTTKNDAFPTVFLEAWAYSLPIISSNIESISTIVENGKNGILIEPNNPRLLAETIHKLINNKSKIKSLTTEGLKILMSNYIMDKQIEVTRKLFEYEN